MPQTFVIPIEVEQLEDGWFYATCPIIHGCHAEGETLPEALDNVQDIARILLECLIEDGLPLPQGLQPCNEEIRLQEQVLVSIPSQ